jgi:hypothetical protein
MNTDFSLDAIVDASSGVLFVVVGIACVVRARRVAGTLLAALALAIVAPLLALTSGGVIIDAAWIALLFAGLPWWLRRAQPPILLGAAAFGAGVGTLVATLLPPFWGPDYGGRVVGALVMEANALVAVASVLLALAAYRAPSGWRYAAGASRARSRSTSRVRVADELGLTLLVEEETITRGPHA